MPRFTDQASSPTIDVIKSCTSSIKTSFRVCLGLLAKHVLSDLEYLVITIILARNLIVELSGLILV